MSVTWPARSLRAPNWVAVWQMQGKLDEMVRDRKFQVVRVLVPLSHAEVLPAAMLKAMAWAPVPAVTDLGSITDFASDGVGDLIVPPDDADSLAAVLYHPRCQRDLLDRIGEVADVDPPSSSAGRTSVGWVDTCATAGARKPSPASRSRSDA